MELVKISAEEVESHEENYNSNFHTEEEAPGLEAPTELPCAYSRWLPLISKSQGIPSSAIQIISLTPKQGRLIITASQSSLHTRALNRVYAEDLDEIIKPTLSTIQFPPEGLFLRLDACSPKDAERGITPLRTINEILIRLTTSYRANNSIQRLLDRNAPSIELFFMPFNEAMDTALEYRVFCAPPTAAITAVSQYRWHKPSVFRDRAPEELEAVVKSIMSEIRRIHEEILEEAKIGEAKEMGQLLVKQGFTFDIRYDEPTKTCSLIELNTFGTRSGCGACLFHWLRDGDVLYGKGTEEMQGEIRKVEFRISI